MKETEVSVSLHGPGANLDDAVTAGVAMKKLLEAAGEELGIPSGAVEWKIASVQFKCDGCDLRRPDRPGPEEGWTYKDGDDYCPSCSEQRKLASLQGGKR